MLRHPFDTLLVANRGEIAVRILRGARELGLRTVAVHSEADVDARHVLEADLAVNIGPAPAAESYLRIDGIIAAARDAGAGAIHPGYGFLAENPALAEACESAGLVFVGPPAEAIRRMGDKGEARRLAVTAGVPVIPGYDGPEQDEACLLIEAARIGFPLLVKPAAGGGGKGMRLVERAGELPAALAAARREAESAFGDARLILERFLRPVRHVEIQIFADSHGNVFHLLERECSIQRRHQKIIEESPSPGLEAAIRESMGRAAVALTIAAGYRSAGTVEFVLSPDGTFHLLEMNTRLQVEHPVTEAVTGLDLVHLQLREAMGEPTPLRQEDVRGRGHAIECRVYAEDPANGFLPAAGDILLLREPQGPGVRIDSGILDGSRIGVHYDPILAKVVVLAPDRATAVRRMQLALADTVVLGLPTNLPFLRAVLEHSAFAAGDTPTDFLDRHFGGWTLPDEPLPAEAIAFAAALEALETPGTPCSTRASARAGGRNARQVGTAGRAGLAAAGFTGRSRSPGAAGPTLQDSPAGDPFSPWDSLAGFRIGTTEETTP